MSALRTLVRCLLALFLWIGVSGAASVPAAPASVAGGEHASQSDLHGRLLDLLGGVQICGDEASDEDDVLCGGDLLADLFVDPAMLLMSRGTCSRLLEQLYTRQVCDPHKQDCGQLRRGALTPPAGPQIAAPAAAGGLLAHHGAALAPNQALLQALRSRDGPAPTSHSSRPVPPPPRTVLS